MAIRFNRLHFFKRFQPDIDYVLLRNMTIAGVTYEAGTKLDKSLLPTHKIKGLFNTRKIAAADSVYDNKLLTNETKPDTKKATIKRGGPWFKVFDEAGEQLGKPTRDEAQANKIKSDYESA